MDSMQDPEAPKKAPWLINRNYRFLFAGQVISLFGDQVSTYTIILWIVTIIAAGRSWAPLAISAVLISSILPNLCIGFFAGVFVDRWNPRLTMMRADLLRAVLALLLVCCTGILPLPAFLHSPMVQISLICALTFLSSASAQFFNPAYMSLIASIIPAEDLPRAAGLGQTMQAFATILGPLLAAPLFFSFGVTWALLIDALSFIVSFGTIAAIHISYMLPTSSEPNNFWREFKEGFHFSFSNLTIRTLIVTSFIATLGAGAFDALYVFFLTGNLHTSASFSGVIATSLGIGTILGAFIATKSTRFFKIEYLFSFSLAGIGVSLLIISRLTVFPVAIFFFLLFGLFLASLRVASSPLLLGETPQNMIGRVVAVLGPTSTIASLVAAMLSGFLASVLLVHLHWNVLGTIFGPIDTIFVGVSILFLIAAFYAYRMLQKRIAPTVATTQVQDPVEAVIEDEVYAYIQEQEDV
ncbi:MAG: MFS transporter [Ktedonobacteraceae bacterium]|nr:MFS transporter [Ktedonobacteraceae bacterium]